MIRREKDEEKGRRVDEMRRMEEFHRKQSLLFPSMSTISEWTFWSCTSLRSTIVPTCLKTTTIVPVPEKFPASMTIVPSQTHTSKMKCFERLVMRHIKTQLQPSLDPLQFAYRPNRSMDDVIITTLYLSLTHLDNKDTCMNAVHRLQFSIQHNHPSAPD
ncbi:hypothetical protein QTP70_029771 [Hemibagrus guttatus]|uniref:Reverse transcriptase domain-containing protein n=1 Tax=Hemibagrus guttatus TaxID=175788 RepID=A0AAE0QR81_9TELE|nr:hypothetical protein QTP70_029771 [Hemibagrus guttatus]